MYIADPALQLFVDNLLYDFNCALRMQTATTLMAAVATHQVITSPSNSDVKTIDIQEKRKLDMGSFLRILCIRR